MKGETVSRSSSLPLSRVSTIPSSSEAVSQALRLPALFSSTDAFLLFEGLRGPALAMVYPTADPGYGKFAGAAAVVATCFRMPASQTA